MIILNIVSMFLLVLPLNPQLDRQPIVYVKHLEPPLHYPALARAVRFHGTVIVKLTIGTDGVVLGAESSPQDSNMVGFPLLRDETEKLLKTWTFGCVFCSSGPYSHTVRFHYVLEGDEVTYDDTRVEMQLPDEVTITVSPPVCDDCPTPAKPKKSH